MNQEQINAELQRLREENAKLKNQKTVGGCKVTDKGGISFYGLGRFPVTLYMSQWETLLAKADEIRDFIHANKDKLAVKPTKSVA